MYVYCEVMTIHLNIQVGKDKRKEEEKEVEERSE